MASDDVTSAAAKGAGAYIGSFAFGKMKVAGKDDKPVSQKRKAAFDTGPKKQLPKLQFSTANVGKKPGAKEEDKDEEGAAQKKDGKLQLWLRAGNGDRPGCEEAREYLLRGTPYRGQHARNTKDAVKEAGAVWLKNPLKLDDARDGISPGWFVAHTERALIDLIRMPRIKRDMPEWMKRYKSKDETQPQWSPLDVPEKSHETVVLLVLEFEAFEKEKSELELRAANKARDAKMAAKLNAQKTDGIPPDSEKHIEQIKREWGIVWDDDMAVASSRCPGLGPHMGISPVFRVIRGLHLKVCTKEEVRAGEYVSDAAQRIKARAKAAEAGESVASAEPEFIDYTKVPITSASSGCYMFGKGLGMITLPSDKEWEEMKDALQQAEITRVLGKREEVEEPPSKRETWCTTCVCQVFEQFNDCSCTTREWTWCPECHVASCDAQACACEAGGEWQRKQDKCIEESERRTEKAERDAAAQKHMESMHVTNAVRDTNQPGAVEVEGGEDAGETLDDYWGM